MDLQNYYDDEGGQLPPPQTPPTAPGGGPEGPVHGGPAPLPGPSVPIPGVNANNGGGGSGAFVLPAAPNFGNLPGAPRFTAPQFARPTYEQAMQEPGYQFRLGAGQQALERSAAARGHLRSGGTLQDLLEYGQNFGAQEYQNVYNRALSGYDRQYKAAYDEYAPLLAQWQMKADALKQAGLMGYQGQISGALQQYAPHGGGGYEPSIEELLGPPPTPPGGGAYPFGGGGGGVQGYSAGPRGRGRTGDPWTDNEYF